MLSSGIEQVPELVSKLQSERSDLAKQVATQAEQLIAYEAQTILADAHSPFILIFQNRDANALRKLANLLVEPDGNYAVLMNQQGTDVMLMIASSTVDGIHAGDTLKAILAEFDGRGGGRETFAQGVLKNFEDIDTLSQVIDQHV
ncbi:MAG: DHHA1 domain-containing protein [Chloroflexota bacterium]